MKDAKIFLLVAQWVFVNYPMFSQAHHSLVIHEIMADLSSQDLIATVDGELACEIHYVNPDHKVRMDPDILLAAARYSLKS